MEVYWHLVSAMAGVVHLVVERNLAYMNNQMIEQMLYRACQSVWHIRGIAIKLVTCWVDPSI